MRTNNSFSNSFIAVISNVIVMITGFIAQTIFIKILGEEYLGINGLFNNIVSMLAIVELGIGPAIIFSLYKPLAENNQSKVAQIMKFYKKCYYLIALIVFLLGLIVMPFLQFFVNTNINFTNFGGIYLIFFLFILDASFSYICSYKRSIIQADQKNRIINIVHTICYIIMNILQIILLFITKNYILYLIVKVIFRLLENIIISIIADKLYSYLNDLKVDNLDKGTKKSIFTKVRGLIYHKISSYIVLGTDNIIISKYLGTAIVGLYSNYYLIISSVSNLISQIFSSLTSSVGNLLVTSDKDKSYDIYKKTMFLDFWIYGFASTAMYNIMKPFITFWLGEKFLLSNVVLAFLVINFYMTGMRSSIGIYKEAAGIYYEDRYIAVAESIINIVVSLILVKFFGLAGVFMGTFVSSLIVVFYSLPHFVFKKVFLRSSKDYYKLYFKYALLTFIPVILTNLLYNLIVQRLSLNVFFLVVIAAILSLLIPNLLYFVLFHKKEEFIYFKEIIKGKLKRKA